MGAFYAQKHAGGANLLESGPMRLPRNSWEAEAKSRVRERFVEAGLLAHFASLQNLAAVQTLDVLRIVVLGDETRAFVLAGRIGHTLEP